MAVSAHRRNKRPPIDVTALEAPRSQPKRGGVVFAGGGRRRRRPRPNTAKEKRKADKRQKPPKT
jgi:hypothetical protein